MHKDIVKRNIKTSYIHDDNVQKEVRTSYMHNDTATMTFRTSYIHNNSTMVLVYSDEDQNLSAGKPWMRGTSLPRARSSATSSALSLHPRAPANSCTCCGLLPPGIGTMLPCATQPIQCHLNRGLAPILLPKLPHALQQRLHLGSVLGRVRHPLGPVGGLY